MRTQPNKTTFLKNQLLTPKIHNVIILDGSGSMAGAKYRSATAGIQLDLRTCKNEDFATYTFVEFNNTNSITTHVFMEMLNKVKLFFNGPKGNTPLYQTIGRTLETLLQSVPKEDKVLVKIFTDGEHNVSTGKYSTVEEVKPLIATCEARGFTITFIGTDYDTKQIVKNLKISTSNTLVHNNTGEGVRAAFNTQAMATQEYSKRVANNEDVTTGFYSKTMTNNN